MSGIDGPNALDDFDDLSVPLASRFPGEDGGDISDSLSSLLFVASLVDFLEEDLRRLFSEDGFEELLLVRLEISFLRGAGCDRLRRARALWSSSGSLSDLVLDEEDSFLDDSRPPMRFTLRLRRILGFDCLVDALSGLSSREDVLEEGGEESPSLERVGDSDGDSSLVVFLP